MREATVTAGIRSFARQLAVGTDACPYTLAQHRRCHDDAGRPSAEGASLLAALVDQRVTPSVIRNVV